MKVQIKLRWIENMNRLNETGKLHIYLTFGCSVYVSKYQVYHIKVYFKM